MHLTFIPGLSDYLSAPASLPTSCKKVHFHKTFNLMQNSRHDLILYCKTNLCWSFSWNDVWYFLNSKIKIHTNNKHWHFSDVETSLMLCSQSAPVSHNVQCRITGCQRWSFLHTLTFSRIRLIASPGIFQKCLFNPGKYDFKTVRSSSFWFGLEKLGAASWTGSADWEVGNITLAFLGGINANINSIFIIIMKIGKHYCEGISEVHQCPQSLWNIPSISSPADNRHHHHHHQHLKIITVIIIITYSLIFCWLILFSSI